MPAIEPRYAEALLATTHDPSNADQMEIALTEFSRAMDEVTDLRYFMLNPVISADAKKDTVKKLLPEGVPVFAVNLLFLLIDKGRLSNLSGILEEYRRKRAEMKGTLIIKVTSAEPLSVSQIDEISRMYQRKYGADNVQVENRIDKKLLGGIRVQIGDILTDASISGRLRGLAVAINQSK